MPQHKLYVIQDSTLDSMAGSERYLSVLPFLRALRPARQGGCGSCGNRRKIQAAAYMNAKLALVGLPPETKAKLKVLLDAQRIRVTYRRADNKVVELTF